MGGWAGAVALSRETHPNDDDAVVRMGHPVVVAYEARLTVQLTSP
jgi:hypothetical protein